MPYQCPRCHYSVESKTIYLNHLRRKNPCPTQFSDKPIHDIIRELEEVYEEKPHACRECNHRFVTKGSLTRHILSHHPESVHKYFSAKKDRSNVDSNQLVSLTLTVKNVSHHIDVDGTEKTSQKCPCECCKRGAACNAIPLSLEVLEPSLEKGFVYLTTTPDVRFVKVGMCTTKVKKLRKRYFTYYGGSLQMLCFPTPTPRHFENVFKIHFRQFRIEGERFEKEHWETYVDFLTQNVNRPFHVHSNNITKT